MSDQKALWNTKHGKGEHQAWKDRPNPFALGLTSQLKPGMKLLDLGCGVAGDARYFAQMGVDVTATDFSDVVIEQDKATGENEHLHFEVVDITMPLPYEDESFDVVYAHLSLHYYHDQKTREIISEIARVLKPGGQLFFSCKSTKDPYYGQGEQIGPDIFENKGHIRHLFRPEYARDILNGRFEITKLEEPEGQFGAEKSAFVEVWAKKKS